METSPSLAVTTVETAVINLVTAIHRCIHCKLEVLRSPSKEAQNHVEMLRTEGPGEEVEVGVKSFVSDDLPLACRCLVREAPPRILLLRLTGPE
ncbi:hypothetical protein QYE76_008830 [Lolium multiflorum]|uniref:Uncharacterized protein n=1 Tax=Lolium multiflorum TaxID=4521 RepID=A0AAD8TU07_LOLMU|nr:hypothetical protein QYE76_008824 [Lolium multiflorum]KAK1692133.1 hypothetical protein QYE76_008830 [Lolium multiflorum]